MRGSPASPGHDELPEMKMPSWLKETCKR
jgi:hypothetical protein